MNKTDDDASEIADRADSSSRSRHAGGRIGPAGLPFSSSVRHNRGMGAVRLPRQERRPSHIPL